MKLFFDTETTGKADFRSEPDAPHQPRLVQLGAILTDDSGQELASVNLIIKPNGFTIPAGASAVHGITDEIANNYGVNLEAALPVFAELCTKPHVIVGHNVDYDVFVMRGEFLRAGFDDDPFGGALLYCTMKETTDLCQLPGPYGFKWPKLQEAYEHCFGSAFEGAHDAMADVRACASIYWWLMKQKQSSNA